MTTSYRRFFLNKNKTILIKKQCTNSQKHSEVEYIELKKKKTTLDNYIIISSKQPVRLLYLHIFTIEIERNTEH